MCVDCFQSSLSPLHRRAPVTCVVSPVSRSDLNRLVAARLSSTRGWQAQLVGGRDRHAEQRAGGGAGSAGAVGRERDDAGPDDWINFDDAEVTECKWEHVVDLKGGGDRDIAYMCFYRVKEDKEPEKK